MATVGLALGGEPTAVSPSPAPPVVADDDGRDFNLWPIIQYSTLPDGMHRTWLLGLFHRTTKRDGSTWSYHVLNFVSSRDMTAVLPVYWRFGPQGAKRTWVVPLWFHGPEYTVVPPALTASWRRADGGHSTWVTPLVHVDTMPDGALDDLHVLTWFQGHHYVVALPLAYAFGAPECRHVGVLPLWFSGPTWWTVPLALSGGWTRPDGSSSSWFTPLAHIDYDRSGEFNNSHCLNWLHGHDYDVIIPLAWRSGPAEARHIGVVPLFAKGPGYWAVPAGLTASWKHGDGGRTTWVTPLFHVTTDAAGTVSSLHALTYIRGGDWHVAFPFEYAIGKFGKRHIGVVPLFAKGPGYWAVPGTLTASWANHDGGRTTWVTPLFHVSTDSTGAVSSLHALTYVRGEDWQVAFPIGYAIGDPGERHVGVVPLFAKGPGYWAVPGLLSGGWKNHAGGRTTWITPLFHRSTERGGTVSSWHVANVIHDQHTTIIFPLLFQGPDHLLVAPLFFRTGHGAEAVSGLLPIYGAGPRGWVAPLGLSARWKSPEGRTTTVLTPLFHRTTSADGQVLHQHLLTYVSTPTASTVFPLYWRWRTADGGTRRLVLPLYYQHDHADGGITATVLPPLFAWRQAHALDTSWSYQLIPFSGQRADDGGEVNVLWRIFHRRRQAGTTELMVGPLWHSKSHEGTPTRWQVLGGLLARERDSATGRLRYFVLWIIPLGRGQAVPSASATVAMLH